MISLILMVACVGGDDSAKDSGGEDDRPPSEISGSSSEACAAAPTSNCIGGDATGTLSVLNAGTELGPWTGYVCEADAGAVSAILFSACIPGYSVVGQAWIDLSFGLEDGGDDSVLTVAEGENTDGMLSDAAGVTNLGKGVWEFTDGTGSLTSDPRGARAMAGSLEEALSQALGGDLWADMAYNIERPMQYGGAVSWCCVLGRKICSDGIGATPCWPMNPPPGYLGCGCTREEFGTC